MLYILSGQDDFTLHQSLDAVKSEVGDQVDLSSSTTILEGQKLTLDELRTVCETVPFLSSKRLVIVHGLLERFGPQRRPRRQAKARQSKSPADKHTEFSKYIKTIPETTVLVLIDGEIKGGNPLFKDLAAGATVKSFPLLREPKLRDWVQKRVMEAGAAISPGAANLLTRLVGSNLWIMTSEIDKLVLFTAGEGIGEDDVLAVVSYTQQANVFTMVDAIMEFKAEQAEQLLQRLFRSGAAPAYLMTMLARQLRMIVSAKELKKQRLSIQEIMSRLGQTSDFVVRKALEQATRYSLPRLREVYHHLLETDLAIKTGKSDPELALTVLVAELCQQGKAAAVYSR